MFNEDKDTYGNTIGERQSLDSMMRFDNEEDLAALGAANVNLTTGVLGDGSGVGDGKNRSAHYCVGIQNLSLTTDITVKYQVYGVAGWYTIVIPAMGVKAPLRPIRTIGGSTAGSTASATLKLWYKDKYVIEGTGPVQLS